MLEKVAKREGEKWEGGMGKDAGTLTLLNRDRDDVNHEIEESSPDPEGDACFFWMLGRGASCFCEESKAVMTGKHTFDNPFPA